ncbi:MAG: acetyl-CoA carboxylase, carboxyltransferase subunit beta [Alphaproteobacteria bacterium]|nr:acetyl-CoA carboxylase, carboxyltransferase subunit beta [Alphaproteobacteria bacterium]
MNWLTNFIRPKIRSIVEAKDIPDHLWQKCPSCEGMLFHRDLAEAMNVCYHCGHHMKVPVKQRLQSLFDEGSWKEITVPRVPYDPLKFKDRKRYADRLKETRTKTGREDAILVAKGTMDGLPVVIAAFDFDFMGGSMGAAVGEGLVVAAEHAVKTGAALIAIPASGGARMQEGTVSLMQMPRTIIAANMVKEAGLPYLVLLTDPTTGGVSASFAMVGDIHIAEPGCMIGFAGKRVIQETIREELPPNFQTAEYLQAHGMVDLVVPRKDLRATLIRLLDLSMRKMRDPRQRLGGSDNDSGGSRGGRLNGKGGSGIKAKITRPKTGKKPANANKASRKKKAA